MTLRKARVLIIMPAHNEADNIVSCLQSFTAQTRLPDTLRIVNDSSTDATAALAGKFASSFPWIRLTENRSEPGHQPGAKVVQAFRAGLPSDWEDYDFIGKFDADIILPPDYFERILEAFQSNPSLGVCSGLLYVEKDGDWSYEPIANRGHVRGPVKFYSMACFLAIGGLRPGIGWDTADVLLARYHGYQVSTLHDLHVRHLRPTGSGYSSKNARLQGKALYNLRYGWVLSLIAAGKMALKRGDLLLPWRAMGAYAEAFRRRSPRMLSPSEGRFARSWRWRMIGGRLFQGFANGKSSSPIGEGNS
jgi:glycosyltransferase involved in cell wall biosynthesis